MQSVTNRLEKERSPYLKAAAHQPVQWYPWSPEAFQEAERLDRPILLDIGASWCHWCHVIDRESYDNPEISKVINEHFIPIKVDRDERPDIDSRYQRAVGALTGQGGWPLTAFLTPRGEVFYGGTYFPPDDRYGQPGFKRILKRIAELYSIRKEDILEDAKKISSHFQSSSDNSPSTELPTDKLVRGCLDALKHQFDFAHGGFGNAPKFFHVSVLELALDQYFFTGQSWLRTVIEKTLEAMGKGGVYDQLGGGFHRYSVDERWVVPHFEKMSYDNAALLSVYSKAFALLKKPFYREIALGIIRWCREALTDERRGGFFASQDADTGPFDDGNYYTWTEREVKNLLTPEEARAILPYFDIEAQGEMHHDPSRNVLFVAREPETLAREMELRPQELIRRLESGKRKLLEARRKRKAPFVDQTLYTHWNGMWIRACFSAFRFLGETGLKEFALETLNRFKENCFHPRLGMGRALDDAFQEGLLEGQTEILAASLEAFEITAEPEYLVFSENLARILLDRFWALRGGFFDSARPKEEGHLRFQERKIEDSPSGSGNATAALILLKLHHLTQKPEYLKKLESLLCSFRKEAESISYFSAGFTSGVDWYLRGVVKVVIVGRKEEPLFERLHQTALTTFHPHLVLLPFTDLSRDHLTCAVPNGLSEEWKNRGHALAVVCKGKSCLPITDNPDELGRQILENRP